MAAGEGNEVGGDFYDVFPRSASEWAMVVGDVSGKGPEAAAVTALARYTLREKLQRALASECRAVRVVRAAYVAVEAVIRGVRVEDAFRVRDADLRHVLGRDVLVALDPSATLAPDAVALLIDMVDQIAGRSAKPDGQQRTVRVSTSDPERQFILATGDEVTLTPVDGDAPTEPGPSELRLPAEALVRLVYGRLDEAHTPPAETAGVGLDDLRQIFRGF